MNKTHKIISASSLDKLIEKVKATENIVAFHPLILPTDPKAYRNTKDGILYRRWTDKTAEIFDCYVELHEETP